MLDDAEPLPSGSLGQPRGSMELNTEFKQAMALHDAGRLVEAEQAYRRILQAQPHHFDSLYMLGVLSAQRGNHAEAVSRIDVALEINPNAAFAHYDRGNALVKLMRSGEALASYDRAIALKPDYVEALCNRGVALRNLGRFDDALADFDKAIAFEPNYAEAFGNRGAVLRELKRMDEALASYHRAIALKPHWAEAHYNRGNTLVELMRLDEALASYDRAIASEPDYAQAHFNRSLAHLLRGNYTDGWEEYEWRWRSSKYLNARTFEFPQWNGEDLSGKRIFLYPEQGCGDTIQFIRYVPLVAARGGSVFLEVPPALLRLGKQLPANAVESLFASGSATPKCDFFCPLMSLPQAFGTTVTTIPCDIPYLAADPLQLASWQKRLADLPGLRVGIVWAGNPRPDQPDAARIDRRRSLTLRYFAKIADVSGVSFVSLQKGEAALQTRSPPPGLLVHDWTDELDDFADTAALIEALDLVISVDTSVVHLAGALGKPVWLLNRFDTCWRWLVDRDDSPWYQTLRQFRQPKPGDWDHVMIDVRTALARLAAEHRELPLEKQVLEVVGRLPSSVPACTGEYIEKHDFERAMALHRAGRLAEAEQGYWHILRAQPRHFDSLHMLGVIYAQRGNHAEAVRQIDVALETNPNVAAAHNNRGNALRELKRLDEALASYDRAITLQPDFAEAFNNRGVALAELTRPEEARASHDRAIALKADYAEAFCNRGNVLKELNHLEEALASYDRAIGLQPEHAESFHNRAIALRKLNCMNEALASYDQAITLKADFFEAFHSRANVLRELRRPHEALASYDRAIALKPDDVEAHNARGIALRELKCLEDALASYDRAITLKPDFAEACYNQGNVFMELKRLDEALATYDRAIALKPNYAEAFSNRGIALRELKHLEEALASFDRAIVLKPNYAEAFSNRGIALRDLKCPEEALASFDRAIALQPDYAEAFNNRGVALADLKRAEEALASYDRAIALQADYAEALCNRGNVLWELGASKEALMSFDRAIALQPNYAEAFSNRGIALAELTRLDEALASYDRAIALKPDYAGAHLNRSLALLLGGDYGAGWEEYEWRWKTGQLPPREISSPQWQGEDFSGKEILLYAEQGFGDVLQFTRYAPLVKAAGGKVILEAPAPLVRLARTVEGVDQVIAFGDQIPQIDFCCPLLSLPKVLRTELSSIPAQIPYLAANSSAVVAWQKRLADLPGLRVGIAWAGNPRPDQPDAARIDRRRSLTLRHFAKIVDVPGVSFVSLQKGETASQTQSPPPGLLVHDWTDELDDFADTAALIEALDLVISVDTSVVHLAGALGKPVWLLNRFDTCWRWLVDRDDSPWYPTLRQFRQPKPGDWDHVMMNVRTALKQLSAGRAVPGRTVNSGGS